MAEIYQNAILCIAASDSKNGQQGLFRKTPKLAGKTSREVIPFSRRQLRSRGNNSPDLDDGSTFSFEDLELLDSSGRILEPIQTPNSRLLRRLHSPPDASSVPQGGMIVSVFDYPSAQDVSFHWLPDRQMNFQEYSHSSYSRRTKTTGIFTREQLSHVQFYNFYPSKENFPLSNRGWALQERLASSRILHYTAGELVWECKTLCQCQCGRIATQPAYNNWDYRIKTLKSMFHSAFGNDGNGELLLSMWKELIYHFSARKLTRDTDRLPAMSGLARLFQARNLGEYCAGLWSKDLASSLVWSVVELARWNNRSTTYTAPTWSWASVIEGVMWTGSPPVDLQFGAKNLSLKQAGRIEDVDCVSTGLDPTGNLSQGTLVLSGRITEAVVMVHQDPHAPDDEHPYRFYIHNNVNPDWLEFCPDSISDFDLLSLKHPAQGVR
jgi:hypothetical protein